MIWRTLASLAILASAAGALKLCAVDSWKDRAEYDLALTIRAEGSPVKRLALLDQWKAKYPQSEQRQQRRELYLTAYQSLGDGSKMLAVAREMIAEQPGNFVGVYWCVALTPESRQISPEMLTAGEVAARQLLNGLNNYFEPAKRPATTAAPAWEKQRRDAELLARRALAWIAWQRKDSAVAETEFTNCLRLNPKNAEISGWFGSELASQKDDAKQLAALWHVARAASLKDEGALSDGERRQMNSLIEQLYSAYHGSTEGLDELKAKAVAEALPPIDFNIETAAVIATRKAEAELERTNPQLAAWLKIKRRLSAPDADAYFLDGLHTGQPLPKFKGMLVRAEPAGKPQQLGLALSDSSTEEVVLQVSAPYVNEAPLGTILEFEAVADAFAKTPFRLTVNAPPEKITGWPEAPPDEPRKKK